MLVGLNGKRVARRRSTVNAPAATKNEHHNQGAGDERDTPARSPGAQGSTHTRNRKCRQRTASFLVPALPLKRPGAARPPTAAIGVLRQRVVARAGGP
jgi:hypothetical protein